MTNTTAPSTAERIAPLGAALFCPTPMRVQGKRPVFSMDMRAINTDKYFLTIAYADGSTHDISLMVPRTGPAKPRIEKWLDETLPGAELVDWDVLVIDGPGSFRGVVGLMTMEVA